MSTCTVCGKPATRRVEQFDERVLPMGTQQFCLEHFDEAMDLLFSWCQESAAKLVRLQRELEEEHDRLEATEYGLTEDVRSIAQRMQYRDSLQENADGMTLPHEHNGEGGAWPE